jgi:hypothetical protein
LIIFCSILRQDGDQGLQPDVFLVAQPTGATLHRSCLVVQPLVKAKRRLVLGLAVSNDALPRPLDHLNKLRVRLQALLLQTHLPVLEEFLAPRLQVELPELIKRFHQQIRRVQTLVSDRQQCQPPFRKPWEMTAAPTPRSRSVMAHRRS